MGYHASLPLSARNSLSSSWADWSFAFYHECLFHNCICPEEYTLTVFIHCLWFLHNTSTSFQPWSLILEMRCDLDFELELHILQSVVPCTLFCLGPVLIAFSCKIKLLWWGFRDEFNSKSLRVSYIQTMTDKSCTSQMYLFLNPVWQGHHLLKIEYAMWNAWYIHKKQSKHIASLQK